MGTFSNFFRKCDTPTSANVIREPKTSKINKGIIIPTILSHRAHKNVTTTLTKLSRNLKMRRSNESKGLVQGQGASKIVLLGNVKYVWS